MAKDDVQSNRSDMDLETEGKSFTAKDIIKIAESFDSTTDMDKKYAAYVLEELRNGETPLYAAKTILAVNGSLEDRKNTKAVAAVLTESRFFYIGTKNTSFASAYGKPTERGSVSLDRVTSLSIRKTRPMHGDATYLEIDTKDGRYDMDIPITVRFVGGISKADQCDRVLKTFDKAWRDFLSAVGEKESRIDEADALVFEEDRPLSKEDLDNLERLAALKESGVITEEEFEAKRKQILGL